MIETQTSLDAALAELDEVAPGAPLLALGQTVLWDEPMKGGLALHLASTGSNRKFVAGVHDTDYFAKLPSGPRNGGRFAAFPHNDTTTRGLWSAAGEFSALFGSETVVTRNQFLKAGLRLAKVVRSRPHAIDEASEAWRWRGIVSLEDEPPLASEVQLSQILETLRSTLEWAIEETISSLAESEKVSARRKADELLERFCDQVGVPGSETLTGFYRNLLTTVYDFAAGEKVPLEATSTTELLRFNAATWNLPRFELVGKFVDPTTRQRAKEAYNEAIGGSEIYGLERFGTGAIPFDLVIPGKGRGTVRLGTRGAVIMAREPQFLSFKKPISGLQDLAEAVERKFGPDCVLIGKAVSLIGMLSREFVFVFHEGASGYVRHTRRFHELLAEAGLGAEFHPILRVKYDTWDAFGACCSWLRLPDALRSAFGTEELCAPSFSKRWREVAKEQDQVREQLGKLRRPPDLIRFLEQEVGGAWKSLAAEYEELHVRLEGLAESVRELQKERHACYRQLRELKRKRGEAEAAKGAHFRAVIFEKKPTAEQLARREALGHEVDLAIRAVEDTKQAIAELMRRQAARVSAAEVQGWHERRRAIELEAELKRMRLIRQSVVASKGLERAGLRPSAWWFPVVCPSGRWFRETVRTASAYLERIG